MVKQVGHCTGFPVSRTVSHSKFRAVPYRASKYLGRSGGPPSLKQYTEGRQVLAVMTGFSSPVCSRSSQGLVRVTCLIKLHLEGQAAGPVAHKAYSASSSLSPRHASWALEHLTVFLPQLPFLCFPFSRHPGNVPCCGSPWQLEYAPSAFERCLRLAAG